MMKIHVRLTMCVLNCNEPRSILSVYLGVGARAFDWRDACRLLRKKLHGVHVRASRLCACVRQSARVRQSVYMCVCKCKCVCGARARMPFYVYVCM